MKRKLVWLVLLSFVFLAVSVEPVSAMKRAKEIPASKTMPVAKMWAYYYDEATNSAVDSEVIYMTVPIGTYYIGGKKLKMGRYNGRDCYETEFFWRYGDKTY